MYRCSCAGWLKDELNDRANKLLPFGVLTRARRAEPVAVLLMSQKGNLALSPLCSVNWSIAGVSQLLAEDR